MRIIVDARPFALPLTGGVGRVAFELVRAFAQEFPQHEIILATTGWRIPRFAEGLDRSNIKHTHIKIPNKIWSLLAVLGFTSLFSVCSKKMGPAQAFFMPNLGFVGRLPRGPRKILLLHDLSFLIEPRWFSFKDRLWHRAVKAKKLIRSADHLLSVSNTTKQDAIRLLGIAQEKISVIKIGSTLSSVPSTNQVLSTKYVLCLGLSDPRKNSATAIEAVKLLRREEGFENLELVLIGGKIKTNVISSLSRNLTARGSLGSARDDNFSWIRTILRPTDAELANLYANAAAFLYPSWYEGYGLPLHEAARHGTPCVASTSGALPETAPAGTIFANPAKPQHWEAAIRLALLQSKTRLETPETWQSAARKLHDCLS